MKHIFTLILTLIATVASGTTISTNTPTTATVASMIASGTSAHASTSDTAAVLASGTDSYTASQIKAALSVSVAGDGSQFSNVTARYPALPYLTKKLNASGTQQYRFVLLGDSFMGNAMPFVRSRLHQQLGCAGWYMTNANYSGDVIAPDRAGTNGNAGIDFSAWITGDPWTISGTTGAVGFVPDSGTPFQMDTIHYYVLTSPTSGTFKLQYSLNGTGAWTDMTGTVSAVSSGPAAMVVTGTLPANAVCHTRIISLSGTTRVISAMGYDSTASGAISASLCRGGIATHQLASEVPSTILNPMLADLAPDCYVWKTALQPSVHTDDPDFSAFFSRINAGYGSADWVVISGQPLLDPTTDAAEAQSAATLRSTAASHKYTFFDCYNLFGDWATQNARFPGGDGTHLSVDGDAYWVDALFGMGIFTNGKFMQASSLRGTIDTANLPAFRDITNVPWQEFGVTSQGGATSTIKTADSQQTAFFFKSSADDSFRAAIVKNKHTDAVIPDSIEFRAVVPPYGLNIFLTDGKFWSSASGQRPTTPPAKQFFLNDGDAHFGGNVDVTGTLTAASFTGITPASIGAATAAQGSEADSAVQPAGLTKAAVGLGNCDNTSDADKPVSTATQTALNGITPASIGAATVRLIKTSAFTAEINGRYETEGNVTVTDPVGTVAGQLYSVVCGSGTLTIGGAGYTGSCVEIIRRYSGSAWVTPGPNFSDPITVAAAAQSATQDGLGAGATGKALFVAADAITAKTALGAQRKVRTTQLDRTSTTTYADDTTLSGYTLAANTAYRVTFACSFIAGDGGIKFRLVMPSLGWASGQIATYPFPGATGTGIFITSPTVVTLPYRSSSTNGDTVSFSPSFIITTGTTGGMASFQWTQNSSSPEASSLLAGSLLIFEPL